MATWLVFEDPRLPDAPPIETIEGADDHATAVFLAQRKCRRRDLYVQSALAHWAEREVMAGRTPVSSADVMGRNHNRKGGTNAYGICADEDCYATLRRRTNGQMPLLCVRCEEKQQAQSIVADLPDTPTLTPRQTAAVLQARGSQAR